MRRTTILVDEARLQEGLRLSRERTASDLLRKALDEYVRLLASRQILDYFGSGVWEGDLATVRGDRPRRPARRPPRGRKR